MKDYAAHANVHYNTLQNWKKDEKFQRAWNERLRQLNVNPETIQEVVNALRDKAARGDVMAAKLFLAYAGEYNEKQEVTVTRSSAELSDEELDALIAEELNKKKAERALDA